MESDAITAVGKFIQGIPFRAKSFDVEQRWECVPFPVESTYPIRRFSDSDKQVSSSYDRSSTLATFNQSLNLYIVATSAVI
jgi:hypothetical protein